MPPSAIQFLDKNLVSDIYYTWGPSAMLCTGLTSVEGHRSRVRESLDAFSKHLSVQWSFLVTVLLAPHSIFYIRPTKPRAVGETWIEGIKLYVPTNVLRQECFRAMLLEETKSQQAFFDILPTIPLS